MRRKNSRSHPGSLTGRRAFNPALETLEKRELLTGFFTPCPAYLKPIDAAASVKPLVTVGDVVDRTGTPGKKYRMVGVPDGLGAYPTDHGTVQLFMNHELIEDTNPSIPRVGGTTYPDR